MEEIFGAPEFANVDSGARKKRSLVTRRPHHDPQKFSKSRKFFVSLQPYANGGYVKSRNFNFDGFGNENKLKKLKLKVGGVTHTIHATSTDEIGGSPDTRPGSYVDPSISSQRLLSQDDADVDHHYYLGRTKNVGIQSKNLSRTSSKEHLSRRKASVASVSENHEAVRKSKRVPKRRVLDVGFSDNEDNDEEIRFLGKLNASKVAANYEDEESLKVPENNRNGYAMFADNMRDCESSLSGKSNRKKTRLEKINEDKDYVEEGESISDGEPGFNRKRLKKGSPGLIVKGINESTPTTRNRALQSGKDAPASHIEFPAGLLPAQSKKKKGELSELEWQLKRAEALQRRRMQSEKAAREAEAEAIRKILGQDSARNKREEKLRRQKDELIQEKSANSVKLSPKTVRWVIGPTGTIVTFSEDIGLPSIFSPVPCSYPPPREKCAGPNCKNAYKYRDSKSKLPLCSLHCYRAIHEKMQPVSVC